jgi:hypothetical protein
VNNVDSSRIHSNKNSQQQSLLCLEIGSVASGYVALNVVTDKSLVSADTSFRLLEASPVGPRFLILALGSESSLRKALQAVREKFDQIEPSIVVDAEILVNIQQPILDAVYALSEKMLTDALVVVETSSVSGCLHAAQTLSTGHGLEAIEIRIHRTSTGGAYGFFTGAVDKCHPAASDVQAKLKATVRVGRVEVIESPSKTLRQYFSV